MEPVADQQDPCQRTLTVEIPWDVVAKERRDYVKEAKRSATVPGFRKGRVPEGVLNRYFEKEIAIVLTERLAPEVIAEKIVGMDHRLAAGPFIKDFRFVEGRPFEVDAVYEVFPSFELGDYRDLKVVHEAMEVTDELVEAELDDLRARHSSARTLDPRPVQEGDLVNVTFSPVEGGPQLRFFGTELMCQVGDLGRPDGIPLGPELKGLEPEAEAEISCQCPEDYMDKDIAGKTIKCMAKVHSIFEFDLPELDDEFAKDVDAKFETLDDLKSAVRESLAARTAMAARAATEAEVVSKLAELHPMDLPKQYFRERLERVAAEMERREDLPPEEREMTPLRAAREAVSLCAEQVLDRIADVEDINVGPEEIQEDINRWAQAQQLTPERARQDMESAGVLAALQSRRRRSKAMQLIIDAGEPAEELNAEESDEPEAESAPAAETAGDQ